MRPSELERMAPIILPGAYGKQFKKTRTTPRPTLEQMDEDATLDGRSLQGEPIGA